MKETTVLDAEGRELRRADLDDDGLKVPDRVTNLASIVGAIRLLEDIARRDESSQYRAAARKQADGLKSMLKRLRVGKPLTDAEILGPMLREIEQQQVKQLPDATYIIDMKT